MQTKPLILWGGSDINPKLYGQTPLNWTDLPNDKRDEEELYQIDMAIEDKRPIIGICRGAQLLCVYNGGALIQHASIPRQIKGKALLVTPEGDFLAPVDHHQIMRPKGLCEIIAEEEVIHTRWISDTKSQTAWDIPHVVYWPKTNSLAVQPHPEWAINGSPFVAWLNNVISDYLGVKENVF